MRYRGRPIIASVYKLGSLSFYFATLFLTRRERLGIYWLYAWCRHCDDVIDGLQGDQSAQRAALQQLRAETEAALNAKSTSADLAFTGVAQLTNDYQVPHYYFMQMLDGMAMDVEGAVYSDWASLRTYCYRVAGTVGLMSCHVLGIKSVVALVHAEAMGIAMQLVNIARDVGDDARMGRCYLPEQWLLQSNSPLSSVAVIEMMKDSSQPAPNAVTATVGRLLSRADAYYATGMRGLRYLPWRAAVAVATARYVYGAIGAKVKRQGADAWRERAWIRLPVKICLLARAIIAVVATLPHRQVSARVGFKGKALSHLRKCEDGDYAAILERI